LTAEAADIAVESPYWRLEGPTAKASLLSVFRRIATSAAPVLDIALKAAVAILAQIVSGAATICSVLLTADVLRRLFEDGAAASRLEAAVPALVALAAAVFVRIIADAATAAASAHAGPRMRLEADWRIVSASLHVELSAFEEAEFYDQLQRARERGALHLQSVATGLVEMASSAVAVLAALAAIAVLSPVLALLMLIALVPEGIAAIAAARIQYEGMAATIALSRHAEMMAELATQRPPAAELRATQAESYVLAEYKRLAGQLQRHTSEIGVREARVVALGRLASAVAFAAVFALLALMVFGDVVTLAVAGAAVVALRNSAAPLARLTTVANELVEKALYVSDFQAFLETAARRRRKGAPVAGVRPDQIELRNVSFSYPGARGAMAIRDVSMRIESGQSIALVGENGSGKTTLAKLIAGLYQPSSGEVRWNEIDISSADPAQLADNVVMVLQEPIRWPRSARDNVRLGRHDREDPEDQALFAAARESQALDVVGGLPQGWDTLLSKLLRGGSDLSVGQWQRFAVARGLYRDAPLLIWDEPTAPLDPKAEHEVYETLRRLKRNRTVVLITHRLASVRNADCIYLLERGALIEAGTHSELMAARGRYAELYTLQAKLYGSADDER
jgi:ATP-binding cassette, subfamily B, bacterial